MTEEGEVIFAPDIGRDELIVVISQLMRETEARRQKIIELRLENNKA